MKATAQLGRLKNDGKSIKKGEKYRVKKKNQTSEWAWKKIGPISGEAQVKTHLGKTYHWCPHHELWSMHKAVDCLLQQDRKKGKKLSGKLKLRVYQAAIEDSTDKEGQKEASSADEDSSTEELVSS